MPARRPLRPARLACLLAAALLAGCAARGPGGYVLDGSIAAQAQSSRVRHIVLHYTTSDLGQSLFVLSRKEVSAHYVVSDEDPPRFYRLVDEDRSAWHAGDSEWYGRPWLNGSSIGIEIVNPGWRPDGRGGKAWQPYPEAQIRAVIALVRDIAERHGIEPRNIVGHSDISPRRKLDPGPLFPWKRLADAGLARWYDETAAQARRAHYDALGLPGIAWFQARLAEAGYRVPQSGELDDATQAALLAFQLRYRPSRFDGQPDAETAAILETLK